MKHYLLGLSLLTFLILSGCASSYRNLRPESIYYATNTEASNIQFSYSYGAMAIRQNKKYVKKEYKKELQVVSLKITNNSDRTLVYNDNFYLKSGDRPLTIVSPSFAYKQLKQGTWIYLLYLPLNITFTKTEMVNGMPLNQSSVFLPTGPFISAGNLILAASANSNFKRELFKYDLTGKSVAPGQTIYGLVTVQGVGSSPIQLGFK